MSFKKVIHTSKDHSYFYGNKKYESVSKVFETAKPDIDWDYNAGRSFFKKNYPELYDAMKKKLAFDHPELVTACIDSSGISLKKFKEERDKLRAEWKANGKEATDRGTAFHTKMENEDYEAGFRVNPATGKEVGAMYFKKEYDNESLAEDLYTLPDGYYPELLIFNHDLEIAGQADMVFIRTEGDRRIIDIDDWKTDANIEMRPDFRHPTKGYQMFKYPLNHLYATNHNTYMVKIGIYAWMLEQFGFEVGKLFFTSVDIDHETLEIKNQQRYNLPYKRYEIEKLLELYEFSK